jgi:hypothetical protein
VRDVAALLLAADAAVAVADPAALAVAVIAALRDPAAAAARGARSAAALVPHHGATERTLALLERVRAGAAGARAVPAGRSAPTGAAP